MRQTVIQLRKSLAQFVELRLPLGERGFHSFHDMYRSAAAKCLIFQALLFRSDVLRESFEFFAQARDFGLPVEGSIVRDK